MPQSYEFAVVVDYNRFPVVANRGDGIFLHGNGSLTFAPGTMEARTVSETLTDKGGSNFSNLVSRLQQRAASPLKAEVTEQEGLVLQVDLKALTLTLQDRLQSLPFIESTQLNHVMTAF